MSIAGIEYEIVPLPKPMNSDYIVLDRLGESATSDLVILKNIPFEGVTIGRDGCNFIKIKDITVSRLQARIKYKSG